MILKDGDDVPRGYGISYMSNKFHGYVCHPFPLNHVVALARRFWFAIRDARPSLQEKRIISAYQQGYHKRQQELEDSFGPIKEEIKQLIKQLR